VIIRIIPPRVAAPTEPSEHDPQALQLLREPGEEAPVRKGGPPTRLSFMSRIARAPELRGGHDARLEAYYARATR
jgi:hypothetical protein